MARGKAHLHSEQFDGHLHTACGRAGNEERVRILTEDDFAKLPRAERCAYCTNIEFPHGGDPVDGC